MEKAQTERHRAGHYLYFSVLCIEHIAMFGLGDIKGLLLPKLFCIPMHTVQHKVGISHSTQLTLNTATFDCLQQIISEC